MKKRAAGWSDPPGHFFYAGFALVINAGVLGVTGVYGFGLHTVLGVLGYAVGWAALAGAFLAFLVSATVAIYDQYAHGEWPSCPECGHEQVPRPWTI